MGGLLKFILSIITELNFNKKFQSHLSIDILVYLGFDYLRSLHMETEISPLEYARSNQLSLNYLADRTGLIELQSFQRAEMRKNLNISDDSHLSGVNFGPDLLIEERLIISKDAAKLIESTTCLEIPEKINSHILNLLEKKKIASSLKCEFPLLQSDHETDSKKFKGREDFEIGIQSVKLPLEEVDEQKNQGLTWSSELWSLSQKLINKLKSEKLCVSKGVLSYLQNSREFFWTSDNSDLIFYNQMTYKRASMCYIQTLFRS